MGERSYFASNDEATETAQHRGIDEQYGVWYSVFGYSISVQKIGKSMKVNEVDFTDINVKAQFAFGLGVVALLLLILLFVRL